MSSKEWLIELTEYTDPYCSWCWAVEPILRKLKEQYGEQIKILFKMGGLVDDVSKFRHLIKNIDVNGILEQIAIHWDQGSLTHGMPVDSNVFQDLKGELMSTYPANIAYKAAQMQDQDLADKFLRRLREGAIAERKLIHKIEIQVELAKEIGLNHDKFIETINNGTAKDLFLKDLDECRRLGITAFPTFKISNKYGKTIFIQGFQRYELFASALEDLIGERLEKKEISLNDDNIINFIKKYEKVATQELATLFDIRKEDAFNHLSKLKNEGKIKSKQAGNSHFWLDD
ncbi:MAG: DsbA family protein [Promethearchaeota archaeon]